MAIQAQEIAVSAQSNILDNGGAEIWQRGAGPFSNPVDNSYSADRWRYVRNATSGFAATITRESSIVDSGSQYSVKYEQTTVGNGTFFAFRLDVDPDFIKQLRGRTVSARARVRATTSGFIAMRINDSDGTGTSAGQTTTGAFETLTTTRSLGATITTLQIEIYFNGVSGQTAYLDNVMFVISPSGVDYLPVHPQVELARCQRYYFQAQAYQPDWSVGQVSGGTTHIYSRFWLPVQMRTTPTVSYTFAQPEANGVAQTGWADGGGSLVSNTMIQISASKAGNLIINNSTYGMVRAFTASAD